MATDMNTTYERPRFFPGQIITADDLTLDQTYILDKLRRHNRMLHGWGIVCGARVDPVTDKPWMVKVNPGYIIGPYGDEICIGKVVCCDLRIKCTSKIVPETPDPCADAVTQLPLPAAGTYFVVVEYSQDAVRPVRSKSSGCGCGENPCENSRYRDGFHICVLDTLPASHMPPNRDAPPPTTRPAGLAPDCPPPPLDGWVVLAAVTVAADGTVGTIDFTPCRVLASHV